MINLDNLQDDYNACLIAYPTIGLADKDGKLDVTFFIIFLHDTTRARLLARSNFISKLDELLYYDGIYFDGEFKVENVKDDSHPFDIIRLYGQAIATKGKSTVELEAGEHEVYNMGYSTTPVTIIADEATTVTGLTDKPITITAPLKITSDGLIIDAEGNNASKSVTIWEFPKLRKGRNVVTTTAPITLIYKERII